MTIFRRDGRERAVGVHEASRLAGAGKDWSFEAPPPPGWERETPRYKVMADTKPAPKERFRYEPPFALLSESDTWQFGTRLHKAGEIIETREWPNPGTFNPEDLVARKIMDFYTTRQKSRLQRSPFNGDRLVLDDGLGGGAPVITPPRPEPVRLPARAWPGHASVKASATR